MLASCLICFVEFIKLVSVVEVFEVSRGWIGVLVFLVFEASRGWIGVLVFFGVRVWCSRCPGWRCPSVFVFGVRGVQKLDWGSLFLEAHRGLFRSSPRLREGRCAAGSFRGALSSRGALSFEDPDSIDAHLVRVSFNLI